MDRLDIISLINVNDKAFTKAEQKVAQFILNDPKQVLYTSISDLALLCDVSEATVFRFCRTLGFDGYHEFKMTLAQTINNNDNYSEQMDEDIKAEDDISEVSRKILITNINALNETYRLINFSDISRAVEFIKKAKRVVFYGLGTSGITALEARDKFMRITPKVDFTFDAHMQSMSATLLTPDDLAIAFSYSGSTKDTINVLSIAKKAGAKTIGITRFAKSPLTQYSDIVLLCGSKEGPWQGGSMSAKMAQLYLLDILYVEYYRQTLEASKNNKQKTSKAVSEKLV